MVPYFRKLRLSLRFAFALICCTTAACGIIDATWYHAFPALSHANMHEMLQSTLSPDSNSLIRALLPVFHRGTHST